MIGKIKPNPIVMRDGLSEQFANGFQTCFPVQIGLRNTRINSVKYVLVVAHAKSLSKILKTPVRIARFYNIFKQRNKAP